MRRPLVVLAACIFTLGLWFGVGTLNAKPAYALTDGGCGYPYDDSGAVYPDGYWPHLVQFWDNTHTFRSIGFDLQAYRMATNSQCYRAYYASVWDNDHHNINAITAHLRAWTCGTPRADWQLVTYNDWGQAVGSYGPNQVWTNGQPWGQYQLVVHTPDNRDHLLDFQRYGDLTTVCGRQADNLIASAEDPYFSNCCTPGSDVVQWYLNVNG